MGELSLTQVAVVGSEFFVEILVLHPVGRASCAAQAQQGLRAVASLVLPPALGKEIKYCPSY